MYLIKFFLKFTEEGKLDKLILRIQSYSDTKS